jgi:hypothetical protein
VHRAHPLDERDEIRAEPATGLGIPAEALQLTQQMVASYEVGRRRVPVSLLPQIGTALAVSVEELIGQGRSTPTKRGPAPKLQQQIERLRLHRTRRHPGRQCPELPTDAQKAYDSILAYARKRPIVKAR